MKEKCIYITIFLMLVVFFSSSTLAQTTGEPAADLALEMVGPNNQGFITSEFVQYIYAEARGIDLPRLAREQRQVGEEVARESLQAGDILFFQGSSLMSGIYVGDGRFVVVTSGGITEINLEASTYWSGIYVGANRYFEDAVPVEEPAASLALEMIGPNEQGFLTSEFVQHVYAQSKGIDLPRLARDQLLIGAEVEKDKLEAGDVVFFQGSSLMSGIYIQNGQFVIVTSSGITQANLYSSSYWSGIYVGANRYTEGSSIEDSSANLALEMVGENHQGFITSEFVQYIYKETKGLELPRAASDQWLLGEEVALEDLLPGDVVFFQGAFLMSGIYIENGRFVIITSEGITERNMNTSEYWSNAFVGAKHYTDENLTPPPTSNEIVEKARSLIGTPYNRRGDNPVDGFNTGSFAYYVYREVTGSWLSKLSYAQFEAGLEVERDELQEGDLVFFQNNDEWLTGIYSGDDRFIIAASEGVQERHLDFHTYYSDRYVGAVRYTDAILNKSNPNTYLNHKNPVIQEAMKYMGTPYLMTGSTLEAFDCSFLIQTSFREGKGIYLPRISYRQWEVGETILPEGTNIEEITLDDHIRPGDALYFSGTWQEGISHVAIYLGDNYMIHATGEEGMTTISYMNSYWREHFTGVKRFDDLSVQLDHPAVYEAYQVLGSPYQLGGADPEQGFDTGGLTQYIYKQAYQYDLPRYGSQQWQVGMEIHPDNAEPGDLLFFEGTTLIPAIYLGNNQMVVATQANGVMIVDLTVSSYWPPRLYGARTYEIEDVTLEAVAVLTENYVGEVFHGSSVEFVQNMYLEAANKQLSGNIHTLRSGGDSIHIEELERGDVMFFSEETESNTPSFIGIYLGDGFFATLRDQVVEKYEMNDDIYWINRLLEARRY
ncbi:NlpC/P60 family protein [Alkalihalophilus marmarensis]|uniref:NlpC/P60 family protein n=1 Tax=Alkalihalophilus marmarensis TaxID=521377 RepID=UPI002E23D9D4|nr:NlpC/P60 family protein [Alkalihalophilus marmarensis]